MSPRFDEPAGLEIRVPVVPHAARMYDFYLGGRNNFLCDRTAAQRVAQAAPSIPKAFRANKTFMMRAVRHCVQAQGIRQFIDVGSGFPVGPSVAELAAAIRPNTVVVGVDHDADVLNHHRGCGGDSSIIDGDIRQPADVLGDQRLSRLIDWREPVGLLMGSVLHHVCDRHDPYGVVGVLRDAIAAGSVMVVSHLCANGMAPEAIAAAEAVYAETSSPLTFRTHEQISRLFEGFDQVPPGVVQVQHWPEPGTPGLDVPLLGGIGRTRERVR